MLLLLPAKLTKTKSALVKELAVLQTQLAEEESMSTSQRGWYDHKDSLTFKQITKIKRQLGIK